MAYKSPYKTRSMIEKLIPSIGKVIIIGLSVIMKMSGQKKRHKYISESAKPIGLAYVMI